MYTSVEILEGIYASVEVLPSSEVECHEEQSSVGMSHTKNGEISTSSNASIEVLPLSEEDCYEDQSSVDISYTKNGEITTSSNIESIKSTVDTGKEVPDDFKGTRRPSAMSLPSGKDGGYGYMVVLVSCLINVLSAGWARTFPLVIIAVQEDFDDYSTGSAGLVIGLNSGFTRLLIPMWGWFIGRFGHRACGIVGALIMSSSLLVATQASTMIGVAIPLGAMWGIGMSMVQLPGVFLVTQYFEKRRATAHGIRMAGMPLGGMIIPFIFIACRPVLGLKGAFILISGILLNIAVLAALYRPFEVNRHLVQSKYMRSHMNDKEKYMSLLGSKLGETSTNKAKKKGLQWSYLKNPVFAVHLLAGLMFTASLPLAMTFRSMYARSIGITSSEITRVGAIQAMFELFWRPAIGAMADRKIFTKWKATIAGMCFYGLITGIIPFMWNFWSFLAVALLHTIGSSIYITLLSVVIAELYGEELLPTTYGFFRSIGGVATFIYPVLIGMIIDAAGSMAVAFYVMSIMAVLASFVMMLQPIVNRRAGLNVNFS